MVKLRASNIHAIKNTHITLQADLLISSSSISRDSTRSGLCSTARCIYFSHSSLLPGPQKHQPIKHAPPTQGLIFQRKKNSTICHPTITKSINHSLVNVICIYSIKSLYLKSYLWEFPVVQMLEQHFHCFGPGFDTWSGN